MSHLTPTRFHRQSGAALLMIMLVVMGAFATFVVTTIDFNDPKKQRSEQTRRALKEAKTALLGYTVKLNEYKPGVIYGLPCPDDEYPASGGFLKEGHSNDCGSEKQNVIGKLPWRSLRVEPLKDGHGECLWYVLSAGYKTSKSGVTNPDTKGLLDIYSSLDTSTSINANTPEDRIVAAIIAPGPAINGQDHSIEVGNEGLVPNCGGNYDAYNYLEAKNTIDNADLAAGAYSIDGVVNFAEGDPDGNDAVVYITYQEIKKVFETRRDNDAASVLVNKIKWLTESVAKCVADYATKNNNYSDEDYRLPYPAAVLVPGGDYSVDYQDDASIAAGIPGRVPALVTNSNTAIGNSTGSNHLFKDCDVLPSVASQKTELLKLWDNWNDHLFYAVAPARHPQVIDGSDPDPEYDIECDDEDCLTVDGSGEYSAVVIFASETRDGASGQVRNQLPDTDTKQNLSNYLEDKNVKISTSDNDFISVYATSSTVITNDIVYCISEDLATITEC